MEKSKEELLLEAQQLKRLNRKPRSDKGKTHNYVRTIDTVRTDKGQKRANYSTNSAAYHKKIFDTFINAHNSETGDNLIRDANLIFPPNLTNYYKKVTNKTKDISYRSSQKRKNHPEELRWRWWFAEYHSTETQQDNEIWTKRICDWYFIKPEDLDTWTYQEWAWSYVNIIASHENRQINNAIILSYDEFMTGQYGLITYTDEGDIIW